MRIILAGMGAPVYAETVKRYRMTKLYSALNEERAIHNWDSSYPLMVDSGAHSWNKIGMNVVGGKASGSLPPLKQWIEYLGRLYQQWDKPNYVLVELDVYAELPMATIDAMADMFQRTIRHATFMRVFHKRLDDGKLTVLKKWLDQGHTYIGLGLDAMPLWGKIFQLTKDRIKYHGFAATRKDLLLKYPLYSADSSTAIAGARYGGNFHKGKYVSKQHLIKVRSPLAVVQDSDARIRRGVKAMYEMQQFVTRVWEERGIKWN